MNKNYLVIDANKMLTLSAEEKHASIEHIKNQINDISVHASTIIDANITELEKPLEDLLTTARELFHPKDMKEYFYDLEDILHELLYADDSFSDQNGSEEVEAVAESVPTKHKSKFSREMGKVEKNIKRAFKKLIGKKKHIEHKDEKETATLHKSDDKDVGLSVKHSLEDLRKLVQDKLQLDYLSNDTMDKIIASFHKFFAFSDSKMEDFNAFTTLSNTEVNLVIVANFNQYQALVCKQEFPQIFNAENVATAFSCDLGETENSQLVTMHFADILEAGDKVVIVGHNMGAQQLQEQHPDAHIFEVEQKTAEELAIMMLEESDEGQVAVAPSDAASVILCDTTHASAPVFDNSTPEESEVFAQDNSTEATEAIA
jgi:hypothetical protein